MRRIAAARVRAGHVLHNGHLAPLHVISVGSNSLGDVVLRCAYSGDGYPGTSLLLPPGELVAVL